MIIKLARWVAELELNREEGASVEVDGIYYEVKGASLKDVEMKFKNFKIYHKGSYWQVADEEIKEEGEK